MTGRSRSSLTEEAPNLKQGASPEHPSFPPNFNCDGREVFTSLWKAPPESPGIGPVTRSQSSPAGKAHERIVTLAARQGRRPGTGGAARSTNHAEPARSAQPQRLRSGLPKTWKRTKVQGSTARMRSLASGTADPRENPVAESLGDSRSAELTQVRIRRPITRAKTPGRAAPDNGRWVESDDRPCTRGVGARLRRTPQTP